MNSARASGILLHPTSLSGRFGIGDLGEEAFRFIDFLADSRQAFWQILPLGPTGFGDSPYQCFSAFAGNPLMISPEKLIEDGFITSSDIIDSPDFVDSKVDFGSVYEWKNQLLPKAFEGFQQKPAADLSIRFEKFCRENAFWLDDYALYRAIKATQDQKPWHEWPETMKFRDRQTLAAESARLCNEIQAEKFYQFLFFRQWSEVKAYSNQNGVKIIGDMPIFAALDSADVWCNQDKFKLNLDGSAKVVAGVPPDYFSKTGQLWGNPIYDWDAMRRDGFRWWVARVYSTLQLVDVVRIDHFRGFVSSWEVPGGDKTAENGCWVDVPGKELFEALRLSLGGLPLIAEDLGVITPDVLALRDRFGFPGMRILQYAFGGDANNNDLPHNYIKNCVAYTGTHDNDTAAGWFESRERPDVDDVGEAHTSEYEHCLKYLDSNGSAIHWDLIRAVWASVADTAITPMQDLLGIGTEGRMNLPATESGNWQWRMTEDSISNDITQRLKDLTEIYGRAAD